jgi:thiol:disulfide interchange protein
LRILRILILLLSLLPLHTTQAAEDKRYVKLRLLPERGTISAEEELWIGIDQSIYPQWHTYWQNPGDSGSAPRIEWTLPEGFEISDIHWPAPHKLPYGPLLNYGYEDHVILLQKLKAPDTLPAGPLTFTADIEILVCKEECIPEFDTLNITLNDPGAATQDNSDYLASAQGKLPTQTDWAVSFNAEDESFLSMFFSISDNMLFYIRENKAYTKRNIEIDINSFELYPIDWGVVDNTATLEVKRMVDSHSLTVQQKRGDRDLKDLDEISGILSYRTVDGERRDAKFTALSAKAREISDAAKNPPIKEAGSTTLIGALIFALLGGMAMNLMPCVFPVLSIKALSLVKIADEHPELARLHGLSYTAGVVLSFVAIAGALIAMQTAGTGVGWGFQLQNPIVVTLLAYLLFIIGLNLSGLFEFGGEFTNIGGKLTQGSRLGNSFFTGVLATLVATPCTAPFMGVAIGFALTQDPIVSLSVFAALGFGLALPYLALSFAPFLQQALPKPGAWMETFKELLAFPMYASAAWLVWVLSQQAGPMGILGVLMGMVAIAFGVWLLRHRRPGYRRAGP